MSDTLPLQTVAGPQAQNFQKPFGQTSPSVTLDARINVIIIS